MLFSATAANVARAIFPFLLAWLSLKVPAVIVAPRIEGVWIGFGEIGMLLAGGWVLLGRLSGLEESAFFRRITGTKGIRIAHIIFGLAVLPVGLGHIFYVSITASLVPSWLPFRVGLAYLTGVGQIACKAEAATTHVITPTMALQHSWASRHAFHFQNLINRLPGGKQRKFLRLGSSRDPVMMGPRLSRRAVTLSFSPGAGRLGRRSSNRIEKYASWSKPEIASFSGVWSDQQPVFSGDGSYLIFGSLRLHERPNPLELVSGLG